MEHAVESRGTHRDRRSQLNWILRELAEDRLDGLDSLSDEEFESWLGRVLSPEQLQTLLDARGDDGRERA